MGRLVADLQLLAELDEPEPGVLWSTGPVDVTTLVADAVRAAATLDPTRTWKADLPSTPLVVPAHRDKLRQVLDNLLANVRTHTPPGTTTLVTADAGDAADAADQHVVIEVADDGPGLSDDERGHAFDRFWRQDPSRSRASGGSGLGLCIVAAIVTAHGGTVSATRTPPHGLTIGITLPRLG